MKILKSIKRYYKIIFRDKYKEMYLLSENKLKGLSILLIPQQENLLQIGGWKKIICENIHTKNMENFWLHEESEIYYTFKGAKIAYCRSLAANEIFNQEK